MNGCTGGKHPACVKDCGHEQLPEGIWYRAWVRRPLSPPGSPRDARSGLRASLCRVGRDDEYRVLVPSEALAVTLTADECRQHLTAAGWETESDQSLFGGLWDELDDFESPAYAGVLDAVVVVNEF